MRCSGCGRENPPDAVFCALCGTPAQGPAFDASAPGAATAFPPAASPIYAGFGSRFAAYVIDSTVLGAVMFIPAAIGITFLARNLNLEGARVDPEQLRGLIGFAGPLAALVITSIYWLYHAWMTSSPRQATLGKLALGLIVTDLDGNRISFWRASLRFFGTLVSGSVLNIGYLIQPFTAKKQALHDLMAGTLVIKA